MQKVTGGAATYFVYDEAGHLIGEYDTSGALIQETVWFGDIPVAVLKPNGSGVELFYLHTDDLNTARRISRPGDNVIVWRWDSDPFGTTAANEDPDADVTAFTYNLRFPGQYFDADTGLNYNYFRDYDAATGRYVESDPIGLLGGINTYAYVGGNTLSRVDRAGLQEAVLPAPWELPGIRPIVPPGTTIDPIMPMVQPDADVEDPSDVGDEATTDEMRQCPRDCRGYLKQLRLHEEKLRLYRLNPDAYDNLGFLKGADALGTIRASGTDHPIADS